MTNKNPVDERLLSIADISRHFSLPESTTRYYCKRFAQFIPSVGEGRRRRYRRETLDIISAILEQMQKSRTAMAVEDALEVRFPRNALAVTGQPPLQEQQQPILGNFPVAALQMLERQTIALETISQFMQIFAQKFVQPSTETAIPQDSAIRGEIETLRMLLNSSEKTQQADLEQLRRWMTRVIQIRTGVEPTAT